MSKTLARNIWFVLALTFMSHGWAATAPAGAPLTPTSPPTVTATSNPSSTEVTVLKAQLAVMQSFTDGLLATVYWSLSALVVVASLLVGFGWFTSVRLHERDAAAIRSELAGSLQSQILALRSELERSVAEGVTTISSEATKSVTQSTARAIAPMREEITEINKAVAGLQTELEFASLQSEARYWKAEGVPTNEMRPYIKILEQALESNSPLRITTSLRRLEELFAAGARMHVTELSGLNGLLNQLPPEYSFQSESIRTALRAVDTY